MRHGRLLRGISASIIAILSVISGCRAAQDGAAGEQQHHDRATPPSIAATDANEQGERELGTPIDLCVISAAAREAKESFWPPYRRTTKGRVEFQGGKDVGAAVGLEAIFFEFSCPFQTGSPGGETRIMRIGRIDESFCSETFTIYGDGPAENVPRPGEIFEVGRWNLSGTGGK